MSDWQAARAALAWFFENLEPGQNPVEFIGELQAHLQSMGMGLPSVITTQHLADPNALMAQLEATAEVLTPAQLQSWVAWFDTNSYQNFAEELREFIRKGDLPWHLHQHKNDSEALCQAIRTLPPAR